MTQIGTATTPSKNPLDAPAWLLMGPSGSGKTFAVSTLLEAGLKVRVLSTEPKGMETLLDVVEKRRLPLENLAWHYVAPAAAGWKALGTMMKQIKAMGYDDLTKIKTGIAKTETDQMVDALESLANFPDDRTGTRLGDVTEWGPDCALVVDSLSGLNAMAWQLVVGLKPAAHQGEWGVAMNLMEQLLLKLTSDLKCFFILIAHVDREIDEITGGSRIMVSTLGRKLAPKVPRFFSEVILSVKEGDKFTWSTAALQADLKNRVLPVANNIPPTFKPLVEAYQKRLAFAKSAS